MSDLAFSSLTELSAGLSSGQWTSQDITRLYLDRINKADETLHAFVRVDEAAAMKQAHAADLRRASGLSLGPLDGLPVAVKDLCDIEGQVTTAGSQTWASRRSGVTCTAIARLLQAGMVMLGKTHMVEFAFGGWGTNPVMGTPRNPWDLKEHRIPGGSSSGSGVAVGAALAPCAIGSDTGGSIRIPASLNNITGLKTTRGLISLFGAIPLSGTLDSIGPMTRTVEDAALMTQVMAGADSRDPSSCRSPLFHWEAPTNAAKPLAGVRIALIPPSQYPMTVTPDTTRVLDETRKVMESLGATIIDKPFPYDFHAMMVKNGYITAAEAFSFHRDTVDDAALPFGPHVRKRIQGGRSISAADYILALEDHRRACQSWIEWMSNVDALLCPTLPFPACTLEEVDEGATPLAAFTRPGNYLGTCGLSLPAGFSADGLPIGMQWMSKPFDEATLIRIGIAFQRATDWHRQRPNLSSLGL